MPAGDLKGHIKIATATTTIIITAIQLMLANWLSSVFATISNPNNIFPGLCWLGTQGFQHWGKWCSYPTIGKSKENLDVSHLEANRFLIVRLLKPQTHSQKGPSNFRSKRMWAFASDLDGLMGPLARLVLRKAFRVYWL